MSFITKSELDSLVKSYNDLHGKEDSYIQYATVKIEELEKLLALAKQSGATTIRRYNGFDGIRTVTIDVLVSPDGKELLEEDESDISTKAISPTKPLRDDPPHCPPQC